MDKISAINPTGGGQYKRKRFIPASHLVHVLLVVVIAHAGLFFGRKWDRLSAARGGSWLSTTHCSVFSHRIGEIFTSTA